MVLSALCLLLLARVGLAGPAMIVFRKTLETEIEYRYSAGVPINVSLDLYNLGDGPATEVKVSDEWAPDFFDVIDGSTEGEFAEIAAGERAWLNFTVVPHFEYTPEKPVLYVRGFPAKLEYTPEPDADPKIAYSTKMLDMHVLSKKDYIKFTAKRTTQWTLFSLGMVGAVFLPFAAWLQLGDCLKSARVKSA